MNNYELRRIVFSDESNYTVINRKKKVIVRRHHNEKYHSRFIVPRLKGGVGSVGIWGCITSHLIVQVYTCYTTVVWTNIDTLTLLKTI
jgi:hypothetical protein